MSLFAGAELASALAAVEGVPVRPTILGCDGRLVPALLAGTKPVVARVWLDFLEPSEDPDAVAEIPIRYLPRVVLGRVDQQVWHDDAQDATGGSLQASPTLDFTKFSAWEDIEAWFRRKRSNHSKNLERALRKAEREMGPVLFDPSDRDEAAFEHLVNWKRAHFARTGVGDPLAVPSNLALFRRLFETGQLELATLRGDGRPMAAIGLVRQAGRIYYWMPSYDTSLSTLAPGNVLLNQCIRHAYNTGAHEFDFMLGDEEYKWTYATDCRLVGPVGSEPVARRVRRLAGGAKRRLRTATTAATTAVATADT